MFTQSLILPFVLIYRSPAKGSNTENALAKRVRFGARIVTKNGRDAHRELNGFFFPVDNTITLYEFHQFGTRFVYKNGKHYIMHFYCYKPSTCKQLFALVSDANWKLLDLLFNRYQIPPVNHLLISVVKPYFFYSQITSFAIHSARLLQPCSGKEKGATIYPDGCLCGEHAFLYMSYVCCK